MSVAFSLSRWRSHGPPTSASLKVGALLHCLLAILRDLGFRQERPLPDPPHVRDWHEPVLLLWRRSTTELAKKHGSKLEQNSPLLHESKERQLEFTRVRGTMLRCHGLLSMATRWAKQSASALVGASRAWAGARLIGVSRVGDELLFGYTTTSSPWLHDKEGAKRFLVMEVIEEMWATEFGQIFWACWFRIWSEYSISWNHSAPLHFNQTC
jgi:hypothetical protein